MPKDVQSLTDEVDNKVRDIIETFHFFRGPLVYVDFDSTMTPIDYTNDFDLFKAVFEEYFDDSLKKIKALNYISNKIFYLGFSNFRVSENTMEEAYKFHWLNLVSIGDDPEDISYNDFDNFCRYILGDDGEKIDSFMIEGKKLTDSALEVVKNKFEVFKNDILTGIKKNNELKDSEEVIKNKVVDLYSNDPHSKTDINFISEEFSNHNANEGWNYFFSNEEDFKIVTDLLLDYFKRNISRTLPKPIDTKSRTKSAFFSTLRSIYSSFKKSQGIIAKDKDFEKFCRSNFLPCKKIPEKLFSKKLCQ